MKQKLFHYLLSSFNDTHKVTYIAHERARTHTIKSIRVNSERKTGLRQCFLLPPPFIPAQATSSINGQAKIKACKTRVLIVILVKSLDLSES